MKRAFTVLASLLIAFACSAHAEMTELTIANQYGLQFLPLVVMEHDKLIEKHAKAEGLDNLKVRWVVLGGGGPTIDALLSDNVQVGVGGFPLLALLWDKTRGTVKGVGALHSIPHFLNTTDPKIKTIRDFGPDDRIALPTVKISLQAILLQIAAAKAFGEENYAKLDPLTVSMKDPDATVAIINGSAGNNTGITAHFSSLPFAFQELDRPGVHTVLTSFDVLGGPFTSSVLFASSKFHDQNPKTYAAFFAAYKEAFQIIERDKRAAAKTYVETAKSKQSVDEIYAMLQKPLVRYTDKPSNLMKFADFMRKRGVIASQPSSEEGYFFPEVFRNP